MSDSTASRRPFDAVDAQAIAALRGLAIDAVEKANSGHPGLPMGAAPMAWVLWSRHLTICPGDPDWPDRDRFVLSAGHGSMLLYALLHLAGYPVSLDDLRDFRQWESRTPGHPETFATPGVEATTGPLGQGAGNSVGMAIAERALRARFPGLVDHRVFVLVSDGDLMEGVACEAASLAGQLGLGRLVWLYDRNDVTLDGPASLSFSVEDVAARHRALGWHVQTVADGNRDLEAIDAAIAAAVAEAEQPSLIVVNTTIGYGAPNKAGTSAAHGAPLGADEAAAAKAALGLDPGAAFAVPETVRERCRDRAGRGKAARNAWYTRLGQARTEAPERVAEFERRLGNGLPDGWDEGLPAFGPEDRLATRDASGKTMNALAARIPEFFGGDADLSCSTKTALNGLGSQSVSDADGRNLHYGVREHAMGAAANGIAYHGGFRTFASTFFCFADYMRPSVRLAALSGLPVVYVWTHDSVGVGEDGPTHQPVEHLMSLRAMPNLHVVRPADANETVEAWRHALDRTDGPTALVLTRQKVPTLTTPERARGLQHGGYVLRDPESALRAVVIATGSEVSLAVAAAERLDSEGLGVRVVSLPCWELFEAQSPAYRESVLPAGVPRVAVEAGATLGWERYVGSGPVVGVDRFGASAPGAEVAARLGLTEDAVCAAARSVVVHRDKAPTPFRRARPPQIPLHGVDFSGKAEKNRRNSSIWIASWYPDQEYVELTCGGDRNAGFDRCGLVQKINDGWGVWVLDFPFGPPARFAKAMPWASWRDYLEWCRDGDDPQKRRDPKELRDTLRDIVEKSLPWSTNREVDCARGTTWFPFFEQLYKQTIEGARILHRLLVSGGLQNVGVLPFNAPPLDASDSRGMTVGDWVTSQKTRRVSFLVEGFPGFTLGRLGLPCTGYKNGDSNAKRRRREEIVNALCDRGLPICLADVKRAVEDHKGDAVDALVLLDAARSASDRHLEDWNVNVGPNANMEGWFFD